MLSVSPNIPTIYTLNSLNQNYKSLVTSSRRLSTGLRINSAADDAAGLQIANRLETQINGMDVATRNANDAISMVQVAEGAMGETTNILNRIRDLSLQSANSSVSADDRKAMQYEVDELLAQIDDIANQTNYSGIQLLDGSASNLSFQVGSNAGETLPLSIGDMGIASLGQDTSYEAIIPAGVQVNADDRVTVVFNSHDPIVGNINVVIHDPAPGNGKGQVITDEMIVSELNENDDLKRLGISAEINQSGNIQLSGDNLGKVHNSYFTSVGMVTAIGIPFVINEVEETIADINIETAESAQDSITIVDKALAQVDEERANLGATQNRLDYTISNLQTSQSNLVTSQSRIQDADYARESVAYTESKMLININSTLLSQARDIEQQALLLLL